MTETRRLATYKGKTMPKLGTMTSAVVVAVLLASCSPTAPSTAVSPTLAGTPPPPTPSNAAAVLIHIANRSASAITVGPGLSIPACGLASATGAAYDAAREAAFEMVLAGRAWDAPAEALVWDMAIAFEPNEDWTFVISSTAPIAVHPGLVAEVDLPACGGEPMGIEPGLPQGVTPTVTPLP